jgi:hypothetical protein
MPTDWTNKARNAITNLETKTARVLEPNQALAIIDDIVEGKFVAADLAKIHGIPGEGIRKTLGHITRAVGTSGARSLDAGSWYAFHGHEHPYEVAPGFAAAWKKARDLE